MQLYFIKRNKCNTEYNITSKVFHWPEITYDVINPYMVPVVAVRQLYIYFTCNTPVTQEFTPSNEPNEYFPFPPYPHEGKT